MPAPDSNTSSQPLFPGGPGSIPRFPDDFTVSWRDRVAHAVCNWTLRHVATPWYARHIAGYIRIGMMTVLKEAAEGGEHD